MQVLFRGHSTFTEIPDNTPPGSQPVFRGDGSAPALTAAGQDAAPVSLHDTAPVLTAASSASSIPLMDTTPVLLSSASPQMVSVASVVTEGPALTVERAAIGTSGGGDGGTGAVGRDGEHFASLSIDAATYGDHGWLIVPSASNEYGDAVATAGDGFSFDVAAGEFTADWVFIA